MQQALNLIKSSNDILILTHKNPDGDAVGSVLGLALALRDFGKNAVCFSKDDIPRVFDFLPDISMIGNRLSSRFFDLVVLLDCADFSRTGVEDMEKIISGFDNLLIIDHHPENKKESDRLSGSVKVIDEKASSTSVLIHRLLKKLDAQITKNIAASLLTGLFTDTGGFHHDNTNPEALKVAAELMKKGPRIDKISKNIFSGKSITALRLWGRALSRVKTDEKTGMAVSYISKEELKEYGVGQEELTGLVSMVNTVSDAKFSLFLTEYDDRKIRGSLRSEEYKSIDVSRIARILGGGGHKLASGFEMEGDIKSSVAKITELISKAQAQN